MTANQTEIVTADGELVLVGDHAPNNLTAAFQSLTTDNGLAFSSIGGDDFESQLKVAQATNDALKLIDHQSKPIKLKHIIAQVVELPNEQTGKIEQAPRVTLIDEDGTAYVATSMGIFNSVRQLMSTVGNPASWPRAIDVYAVEEKGRNNFRYLTLKYGKPSGK